MVLEKALESPLGCKGIKPVHPKGNQSWKFIGRTDAEAETLILWPRDAKTWFIWKDPDAGKDWGQEKKGTTEDEIDGWIASPTGWTWVWASSGSWWWTGKPGLLKSTGSQRVRHYWGTELNSEALLQVAIEEGRQETQSVPSQSLLVVRPGLNLTIQCLLVALVPWSMPCLTPPWGLSCLVWGEMVEPGLNHWPFSWVCTDLETLWHLEAWSLVAPEHKDH